MRTVSARASEFAIVVAVVAIGAENLGAYSHGAAVIDAAIQVQHVGQQAGLWETAVPDMHDGMAGDGRTGWRKLRDHVQRIARRNCPHREVSIDRKSTRLNSSHLGI